jgi:hypothetical protein
MYLHHQLVKARHDEMLRAAAQHRLARQARITRRPRAMAAPARRLAALRLRKLFS